MASEVCLVSSRLVSDLKGGNVRGTPEEGEIVVKEEMEDEAPLVDVQIKHENDVEMKPNDCQGDGAPFLAGNLLPVTIKEEGEEVEVLTTIVNPASTSTATPYLYKCHLCPAAFTHYQITREHIRGHSLGCRSYVCSNCQQAFYSKSELSQHQLEHSNCHQALLTSETEEPFLDPTSIQEVPTTSTPSSKSGLQSTPNKPPNQLIKEDDDDEVVLLKSPTSQLNLNPTPPPTSTQTPKKGRYQCSICSASFSDSATTLEHIRGHFSTSRRATCPHCKQVFYSKAECNAHQVAVHGAPPEEAPKVAAKPSEVYTAPSTATATMKNTLTRHLKDVHAKEESATATSPCELQEVKKKKKRRFVHRCTHCPRTFTKSTEFTSHLVLHQQNVAWKCEICSALYPTDFYRRKHQEEAHQGGEEVDEDDESSSSATKDELANYTCPTCPLLSYTTERSLRQHIRLKHPGTEPLICPQASGASLSNLETYTTESNSNQEMEEDTVGIGTDESGHNQTVKEEEEEGPRLLSCLKSPLTYANKHNLGPQVTTKHPNEGQRESFTAPTVSVPASPNADTQMSTDQPPDTQMQAEVPAEGVSASGPTKRKPKPVATFLDPLTCPHCKQLFYSKAECYAHQVAVHGAPPEEAPKVADTKQPSEVYTAPCPVKRTPDGYSCEFCGKLYPIRYHLALHLRQHTGERPYLCTVCTATFTIQNALTRHLKEVHGKDKENPGTEEAESATSASPWDVPKTMKKEIQRYAHRCTLCPRTFQKSAEFTAHLALHRLNVAWKCTVCGALYSADFHRRKHQEEAHNGDEEEAEQDGQPASFPCPICPQLSYPTGRSLRQHIHLKHPPPGTELPVRPNRHLCGDCGKAFAVPVQLADHRRAVHTGERPYGCSDCDFRAPSKSALAKHRKAHTGEKRRDKSDDLAQASSPRSLSNLDSTDTAESRNSTQETEEETIRMLTVKEEDELGPTSGPSLLSNLKSPLTYVSKHSLGPHQITPKHPSGTQGELSIIPAVSGPTSHNPDAQAPTDEPPDVFQVTSKAEGVSASGATKRKAKPAATPVTCPACHRTYANSHTLRLHTRIKHPEPGAEALVLPRRHLCLECNKAFPSPSHLADHTRSRHTGERPYACVHCDYRAPTRKDLLRHVRRRHADAKGEHRKAERPVACPQCPRCFKGKAKMAQHVKGHHEGNSPWGCDVCGSLFGGKRELSRHRSMEHGEPLPKTKKRKVEVEEEGEEMDEDEDEEMDQIAVFQDHPEVKEEFEDDEEEIVFCKTIK